MHNWGSPSNILIYLNFRKYQLEYRTTKNKKKLKVHVAEMHMLRWMFEVTRKDRIRKKLLEEAYK